MAYTKTTWSTGDVITATKLNNLETQHEKILGEANTYTATPTFSTGAVLGGTLSQTGDMTVSSTGSIIAMLDSDNDGTGALFAVRANNVASNVFSVSETGLGLFRDAIYRTATSGNSSAFFECYSTNLQHEASLHLQHADNNSLGSRTAVRNTQWLGVVNMAGGNGTSFVTGARIRAIATENWSASANGTYLSFQTIPNGHTAPVEQLALSSSGLTITGNVIGGLNDHYYGADTTNNYLRFNYPTGAAELWANDSIYVMIDSNNNSTGALFGVRTNGVATNLFQVSESGNGTFTGSITGTSGAFTGDVQVTRASAALTTFHSRVSGDTNDRILIDAGGSIFFGPGGSSAVDTKLYRSAADKLKTDDAFEVGLTLTSLGITSFGNIRDSYVNSTASSIYATVSTGAAYPFTQAGHLVLEPRFSGATRDVVTLKSDGSANLIAYGAGGAKVNGAIEATGGINPNASGGQSITVYKEETATLTLTGMTTTVTTDANITQIGRQVSIQIEAKTGTSNSTALTLTGLPSAYYPTGNSGQIETVAIVADNGTYKFGRATIGTGGTITLRTDADSGAFTNTGTKGIISLNVVYSLV